MAKIDQSLFIDTNIIVYASEADSPFHASARGAIRSLDDAGHDLWISRQIIREYLAAMTRGGRNSDSRQRRVLIDDARLLSEDFNIAEETPATTDMLLSLLESYVLSGPRIHDANIAATMLTYGIHGILTENVDDFAPFRSLINTITLADLA